MFLAVLIGLPLPLLLTVDISRGRAEGRQLVSLEGTLGESRSIVYTPVSVVVSNAGGREEDQVVVAGDHRLDED